jgi:hypothetical protein
MSFFWLLSILILAAAFGVLVWTFVWVARLLASRGRQPFSPPGEISTEVPPAEDEGPTPEEEEADQLERTKTGTGVNATLGLILSFFACLLFWLSPFLLVLSVAGLWFSGNATWLGLRLFRVFILRVAVGILLGLSSVGLQFGYRTGLFTLPF